MKVTNAQELTARIKQLREAQKKFATYTQEQVDEIFRQAALAANHNRIKLAKLAVEETGMGIVEDKVVKNNFAAEYIYNQYKNMKTCGVLEEDKTSGITKVAEPIGVISAIVPTTNPTSTAIFKCLIALKTRNAIIISPHPRAKKSTIAAAKLCLEAGAIDVLISDTEEREESIWKARGAFLEAIKGSTTYMDEVDMVVPRSRVNEMVTYLHDLHNEIDIRIKSFGHAGDGNLHAYILKDDLSDEEWEKRMSAAMEKIYQKAHELEGQVSGEHGIGYAKKPYLRESLPEKNLDLMNGIKKVFDPKNILNPHKVAQL